MEKFWEALLALVHRLIDEAEAEMFIHVSVKRSEDVFLTMPDFLIKQLHSAISYKYLQPMPGELGKLFVLRGIEIRPSCDMAITIFHKDYPLYNESWMIRKIPLQPAQSIKGEWFTKYVVEIQQQSWFSNQNSSTLN